MDQGVRYSVVLRDGGCIAPLLGASEWCRTQFGKAPRLDDLEIDHVRGRPQVGLLEKIRHGGHGKRPPDDMAHLASVCWWHHQGGNPPWALGHRDLVRAYLANTERGLSRYDAAAAALAEWGP